MVQSINPVVYGDSRRTWIDAAAAHIVGGAAGGAIVAATCALVFSLVPAPHSGRFGLLIALAATALLLDSRLFRARVPSPARQVPSRWRRQLGPRRCAFCYGILLGGAFGTRISFALTYVVLVGAGLVLPVWQAALVGAAFGAARSSIVLLNLADGRPGRTRNTVEMMGSAENWVRAAGVGGLVVLIGATTVTGFLGG
jgi:hypothetical protein